MTSSLIIIELTSNMSTQQQVIKGNFFLTYQHKMEGNEIKDFTIEIKVEFAHEGSNPSSNRNFLIRIWPTA